MYDHVERMQNQQIPKQTAKTTMKGTRKTGRPCKRWRDEGEGDLNIMGIKKHAGNDQGPSGMAEDCIGCQGPQETAVFDKKRKKRIN